MVIFDALKSMFPGSSTVARIGSRLGFVTEGGAGGAGKGITTTVVGGGGAKLMAGAPVFHQTVNFNISALDGPSVAEVIRSQKGTIASVVAEAAQESTAFKRALR